MEAVPCAPVLHENAVPDSGYPLIRVRQPHLSIADDLCSKVIKFSNVTTTEPLTETAPITPLPFSAQAV